MRLDVPPAMQASLQAAAVRDAADVNCGVKVEAAIHAAVQRGQFQATVPGQVSPRVRSALETAGYTVRTRSSGHNETETVITWPEP